MNRHGRLHLAPHAKTISMTIRMVFSHAEIYCTKMNCLQTPQSWQKDLQQMTPSARLVGLLLEGMDQLLGPHSDVS
jgi:hypothetical protein